MAISRTVEGSSFPPLFSFRPLTVSLPWHNGRGSRLAAARKTRGARGRTLN